MKRTYRGSRSSDKSSCLKRRRRGLDGRRGRAAASQSLEEVIADANFSILRRAALSLLKNNRTSKVGVKNKRLAAGWDNDYLAQVLFGT